jgi:hypothetical protein
MYLVNRLELFTLKLSSMQILLRIEKLYRYATNALDLLSHESAARIK